MPDWPAVKALSASVWSTQQTLESALRRAGYDPEKIDELPDPGECTCDLATAIHRWRAATDALDVAKRRTSGWRY